MSKIQDALDKIQRTRPPAAGVTAPEQEDSMILAKLVDRGTKAPSYDVSDKCLHVDGDALRTAGLIAPEYHEQLLANQYRDIKRPLIAHAFGKRATKVHNGNLIMVTSAVSGEGKTFTSINLALSMARERDYSVLLVDADVAKPHTSEMFGAASEPGLLDLLETNSAHVQSMILPTDVENLSVLPAGKPRLNATELLASGAMETLCETLANLEEGQLVVFDSPPVLQTSEAKVLAGFTGQVVVVVKAEETAQDAVVAAVGALGTEKAVCMVLNQMRMKDGGHQYSYGYGYGYGYAKEESGSPESVDEKKGLFD